MKPIALILILSLFFGTLSAQTVNRTGDNNFMGSATFGTGTTTYTATDASAWMQIGPDGTTKGILLPRVDDTSDVSSPAKGLMVFSNADSLVYVYTDHWEGVGSTTDLSGYLAKGDSTMYGTPTWIDSLARAIAGDSVAQRVSVNDTTGRWAPAGTYLHPADTVGQWYTKFATYSRAQADSVAAKRASDSMAATGQFIRNQITSQQSASSWTKSVRSDTITNSSSPKSNFDILTSPGNGIYFDNISLNPRINTYSSSNLYISPSGGITIFKSQATNSTLQIESTSFGYSRLRMYGTTDNRIETNSGDLTISPAGNTNVSKGLLEISNTPSGTAGADSFVVKKSSDNSLRVVSASEVISFDTVSNIVSLEEYSGPAKILIVLDTLRGGTFTYSLTGIADSGTVFRADGKGSGYWKRSFTGTELNVCWFGALNDSSTDASPAIQAAIDALDINKGHKGGTVYIPGGVYRISHTIYLGNNVSLRGDFWTMLFLADSANCNMFQTPTDGRIGYQNIRNLQLWGNQSGNTSGKAFDIIYNPSELRSDYYFENILIAHFPGDAVYVGGGWQFHFINCIFELNNGYNFHFEPHTYVSNPFGGIRRVQISGCNLYGGLANSQYPTHSEIFFDASLVTRSIDRVVLDQNTIENAYSEYPAIQLTGVNNFVMSGNSIRFIPKNTVNIGIAIVIDSSMVGQIGGNLISTIGEVPDTTRKAKTAISITNSSDINIVGNKYYDFTGMSITDSASTNITYGSVGNGVDTLSGDGTSTTFHIAGSFIAIPESININPISSDAAKASFYVTNISATGFDITSTGTTPPSGTDNVKISWVAYK